MASHEIISGSPSNLPARSFLPVVAAKMRTHTARRPKILLLGVVLLLSTGIGCIFFNYSFLRSFGLSYYIRLNDLNDYQHGQPLSLLVANNNNNTNKNNNNNTKRSKSPTPPQCSYELLYNAFRPNKMKKTSDNKKKRDCWSPQDEILQIPVDSILNRNTMSKSQLGSGSKGGVYTAILKLDGAGNVCTAALKTQECKKSGGKKGWTSCVHHESAYYVDNHASIAREFMGGFLYIATRKAGIELPSLIPTWGVVVTDHEPYSRIPQTNITYPIIVGVVMPIRKLTTVLDIVEYEMSHLIPNTWMGVVRMMLPAAEALLFMEHLGMSFQDPMSKNIGIPKDESRSQGALVYDNTHLSLLDHTTCSIKLHGNNDKLSEACNFCNKEYLSSPPRHGRGRKPNVMFTKECQRFGQRVESLTDLLVHNDTIQQTASEKLMDDMNDLFMQNKACQLEDLVEYLRNLTGTEAAIITN
eukprot:scaffold133623_cov55-Attheya_sp.AAC.2